VVLVVLEAIAEAVRASVETVAAKATTAWAVMV
jgi:hypothetical protein